MYTSSIIPEALFPSSSSSSSVSSSSDSSSDSSVSSNSTVRHLRGTENNQKLFESVKFIGSESVIPRGLSEFGYWSLESVLTADNSYLYSYFGHTHLITSRSNIIIFICIINCVIICIICTIICIINSIPYYLIILVHVFMAFSPTYASLFARNTPSPT